MYSVVGILCTVLVVFTVVLFTGNGIRRIATGSNPQIARYELENQHWSADEAINSTEVNWQVAVNLFDLYKNEDTDSKLERTDLIRLDFVINTVDGN